MHEIREKFVHEFMCEFAFEFMHEFMHEDYIVKERISGKVSVSLILSSSVEFYLHGQTLRYVDIIKGNILFEITQQAVC